MSIKVKDAIYLSTTDISNITGMDTKDIRKLFKSKGFPAVKINGKYYVDADDLKGFIAGFRQAEKGE